MSLVGDNKLVPLTATRQGNYEDIPEADCSETGFIAQLASTGGVAKVPSTSENEQVRKLWGKSKTSAIHISAS